MVYSCCQYHSDARARDHAGRVVCPAPWISIMLYRLWYYRFLPYNVDWLSSLSDDILGLYEGIERVLGSARKMALILKKKKRVTLDVHECIGWIEAESCHLPGHAKWLLSRIPTLRDLAQKRLGKVSASGDAATEKGSKGKLEKRSGKVAVCDLPGIAFLREMRTTMRVELFEAVLRPHAPAYSEPDIGGYLRALDKFSQMLRKLPKELRKLTETVTPIAERRSCSWRQLCL